MRSLRLHTKTTLLVSAITVALLPALLLLVSLRMVNLVREDEQQLARLQAQSVAEQISLMQTPRDPTDVLRAMEQAQNALRNALAVRVWEIKGSEFVAGLAAAGGAPAEPIPESVKAQLRKAVGERKEESISDLMIEGRDEIRYRVFAPITEQNRLVGAVEVVEGLDNVPSIVRRYAQTATLLALASVLLMTIAIDLLFRFMVYRPMDQLIVAMGRVQAGSLDVQVPITTEDEFGRLGIGFNRMIRRIRELSREREAQQEILRERVREATAESDAAAERHQLIFDSNPLPIWVYDPETLAFLTVNQAAVETYGWPREEFAGLTLAAIYPAEDLPRLRETIARPEAERAQQREWRHRRRDGTLIEVELFSHDLMYEGRKAQLVIAHDVTEKKRIEASLLRSQRLESLGTLAGGIAHDLNNILSPLTISTYLLRSRMQDEQGRETLDTMEEVIERGTRLVQQVLAFARGAEGERSRLAPDRLLREVLGILQETFPKSIRIESAADSSVAGVLGNPTQIHQVLMNLCLNARDAMPGGGRIRIELETVRLDEHAAQLHPDARAGRYVRISVRDTGTGISPQIIDKIFDPFFTTKEQGKGTGLGLSTSLGIVRSHGGFIDVYSEPGAGSEFKVYLPALDAPVEEAELAEAPEPPGGQGEWILLADDEEPVRRSTRGLLEAFNYRVLLAEDGRQACALYRERRAEIRAVLTDMMMPVMDGATAIAELRALDPHLPIIAGSGLAETGKEELALGLGARAFLPKPYRAETLLWTLHDLLQTGRRDKQPKEPHETDSRH